MCGRMPKAMEIAGTGFLQLLVSQALPLAEILFGEIRHLDGVRPGDRLRAPG